MTWLRRALRWVAATLAFALLAGGLVMSVVVLRDPAIRGEPLGAPTPWPVIILEEAAAPSPPRWVALGRERPPPRPVRACVAPRPGLPLPTFGDKRFCGPVQGQVACARRSVATPDRARSCALHATRVGEALLRRGNAGAAWAWFTEARILLGIGAGAATDPAVALELALRIRRIDLDVARWLPWFPSEEALQGTVAGLQPAGDTPLLGAVRSADWPAVVEHLPDIAEAPLWRTDSVAVAILARSWHGVDDAAVDPARCSAAGIFWRRICAGDLTNRGKRDPGDALLDVAREDARAYRRAERERVDSLVDAWAERQPTLMPERPMILGSDARLGRFLLRRAEANGLAVPWPRVVVLDVGRSLDRVASTLAHELGHHVQFRDYGVLQTYRLGEPMREADADAWGRAFLCRVGGASLGRLGARCPELVGE